MDTAVTAAASNGRGEGGAGQQSLVPEARRPRLGAGRGAQDPRLGSRSRRHVSRGAGGVALARSAARIWASPGAGAAGAAAARRSEGPRGRRAGGRGGSECRRGRGLVRAAGGGGHGRSRAAGGGAAGGDVQGRGRPRVAGGREPQTGGVKQAWGVGNLGGRLTVGQAGAGGVWRA